MAASYTEDRTLSIVRSRTSGMRLRLRPSEARLPRLRFSALIDGWIARNTCRRQMRQLRMLDDHLLRDIGLTRDDIRR